MSKHLDEALRELEFAKEAPAAMYETYHLVKSIAHSQAGILECMEWQNEFLAREEDRRERDSAVVLRNTVACEALLGIQNTEHAIRMGEYALRLRTKIEGGQPA